LTARGTIAVAAVALLAIALLVVVLLGGGGSDPARLREPRDVADLAARVDRAVRAHVPGDGDARVPQAAVAIVHDGRVAWTRAYGGADADARFQVGSISKPVAAAGLLRLARERGQPRDAPLRPRGWRAPPGMTLRRLLSHTAGLSVPGYSGLEPTRPLPSTRAELNGAGEAPPVRAEHEPGRSWSYSGGGYTVAQLWAEEQTGDFAALMRREVLAPFGMTHSTFAQERPPAGALRGHDAAGRPLPAYRYAALAAAGLWSTAGDVGRFLAFALSDDPLARAMRRPAPATGGHWGLGLELEPLADGGRLVRHEGVNRGWHARFVGDPASGWGLVVLTDSDAGTAAIDAAEAELVTR
jgi:CubicO group peptidase (beta-lactamase class C family)